MRTVAKSPVLGAPYDPKNAISNWRSDPYHFYVTLKPGSLVAYLNWVFLSEFFPSWLRL